MRSGVIEANLTTLNGEFGLPYIPELIAREMTAHERSPSTSPTSSSSDVNTAGSSRSWRRPPPHADCPGAHRRARH
jgi:hypothetical protein